MCVCQSDRVAGASGKGRHRDVCVCVCQIDRSGVASGKGRHRMCVCVCQIDVCECHVRGET